MSVLTYLELKSDIRGIVSCWTVVKQFFYFFNPVTLWPFGIRLLRRVSRPSPVRAATGPAYFD